MLYESIDNTIDEDVTNQLDFVEEYDGRFEDANLLQ